MFCNFYDLLQIIQYEAGMCPKVFTDTAGSEKDDARSGGWAGRCTLWDCGRGPRGARGLGLQPSALGEGCPVL